MTLTPIATIHNAHRDKFGIPRQSGLAAKDVSYIVFKEEFRTPEAIREIEAYSHLWLLWHRRWNLWRNWNVRVDQQALHRSFLELNTVR